MIAVHVTHEAVEKMGGIGTVIAGLATTPAYREVFDRTVLVGPLLATDRPAAERLGPDGEIIYSTLDDIDANGWSTKFKPIEHTYGVSIIYGRRKLIDDYSARIAEVEVVLVDVFRYNNDRLNLFKALLYSRFGIASQTFEHTWEYEQYVRLAEPAIEALHAIGCVGTPEEPVVLLGHEYMGIPTALKAMSDGWPNVRTVFYAHEVASVREIVEKNAGHDLMFYNLLAAGERAGKSLEDYFPGVVGFFKHPIVKAGRHCDAIFAVGDLVGREMRFVSSDTQETPVEIVYNGVPSGRQSLTARRRHRDRLKEYARNLFGFQPDFVFTHVARPVLSKGIWRDLRVLHEVDAQFSKDGRTGAYFMLGTLAGQRRTRDVLHMERVYGWPVHHQRGYPDLCNGEETLGELFEDFNRNHQAVRVVLINQFGWQRSLCGLRMPEAMTIADIRRGTDAEFGLSVYEPFGISQLEPLAFGAICLVSNVCGCMALVHSAAEGSIPDNIIEGDFARLGGDLGADPMRIGMTDRDAIEACEGRRLAEELLRRLPAGDERSAALLESGHRLSQRLSWDHVVPEYFLPAVERLCKRDELAEATR